MPGDLVPGFRYAVVPAGISSTAWPKVVGTCKRIGITFYIWQVALGRIILAKRQDGAWAAFLTLISIPRQVGKSFLFGWIIFALCLLAKKDKPLRVIWTSHHTATTEEVYDQFFEMCNHPRVKPHILKKRQLSGSRWEIVFKNRSRIMLAARERGFGRGKAKIDILVLDEFQHISARALGNLVPTTNAADMPLILAAGTPPDPLETEVGYGEAFNRIRDAALAGENTITLDIAEGEQMVLSTFYAESSADEDGNRTDKRQWALANPTRPLNLRPFAVGLATLPPDVFDREYLGIHAKKAAYKSAADPMRWAELVADGPADGVKAASLGINANRDGDISIVACWREGETAHVEEVFAARSESAAIEFVKTTWDKRRPIKHDTTGSAASVGKQLAEISYKATAQTGNDARAANAMWLSMVAESRITHAGQESLNNAVRDSMRQDDKTPPGWLLTPMSKAAQIGPLIATTAALYAAMTTKQKTYEASF